VSKQNHL